MNIFEKVITHGLNH